jgi:hypothetical protein
MREPGGVREAFQELEVRQSVRNLTHGDGKSP